MMKKRKLTTALLHSEAKLFSQKETNHKEPSLYGITDGKAVGTYLEHKFQKYLRSKYIYAEGSSAKGIDFPELLVDIKVTSITQPQSSCPFKSARQKIYGLGYSLLVFVYNKTDDPKKKTANLEILHTIYVEQAQTADYQTTSGLRKILDNDGNIDDVRAFFQERMLPADDRMADKLAKEVVENPPLIGYLTISNALQWISPYQKIIDEAGKVDATVKSVSFANFFIND